MNGPNSRLVNHESLFCYYLPLSLEEESQKSLTWPIRESSLSAYFANPRTVNFDGHFPLGSKTFPITHLESSDYSLLNQKLQAGWVEHIICKRLAKEGGLGALWNTATKPFNTEQCKLSTRDDLKCLCNTQRLVPSAWLQVSFLPLTKDTYKTAL